MYTYHSFYLCIHHGFSFVHVASRYHGLLFVYVVIRYIHMVFYLYMYLVDISPANSAQLDIMLTGGLT